MDPPKEPKVDEPESIDPSILLSMVSSLVTEFLYIKWVSLYPVILLWFQRSQMILVLLNKCSESR